MASDWLTLVKVKINRRIVILGAAGFIGFHLAKFLHQACDLEILLIDNFVRGQNDTEFKKLIESNRIEFKKLDLSNDKNFHDLFTNRDIVLNCAAFNGTQNFYEKPVDVIRHSAISAVLATEYCAKAQVEKYIYFGSSESYAGGVTKGFTSVPTTEDVPLVVSDVTNPRWSYAASKTLGEVATVASHRQYKMNYIILRIHNIYGPRMGFEHVIPDLIHKFNLGNMEVHGVHETRAFFYINDLNQILFELIFNDEITNNCVYNVGSSNEISILKLSELIRNEMNIDLSIIPVESFVGSVSRRCPDTSFLRSQVKYSETQLSAGIRDTLNWYRMTYQ